MLHSSPQPLSKITILKLSRTRLNKSSPHSVSPLPGVGVGGGHRGAMDHNNLLAAWPVVGPGVAGAVFGAGWWFWVDAVVCSAAAVPFLHYLPGTYARGARSPQASSPSPRLPSLRVSRNLGVSTDRALWVLASLGFFASFAALMFNCVNREDIGDGYYSPYDDSEWR